MGFNSAFKGLSEVVFSGSYVQWEGQ